MALLTRFTAFTVASAAQLNAVCDEAERVARGVFGGSNTNTAAPITKVKRTSTQNVVTSTLTTITWQAEDVDTDNMWDPATPDRLTFISPGTWLLVCCPRFSATGGQKRIYITKNGTNIATNTIAITDSAAGASIIQVTSPARFIAGDQIYGIAYQDSGSTQTLGTDVGGTYLTAIWLGP